MFLQNNLKGFLSLSWVVCLFFFQFVLRFFPGLIKDDLISSFSFSDNDLSWFFSIYFFGYSFSQLLVAVLVERFGVKNVVAASFSGLAFYMFSLVLSTDPFIAIIGRLVGGLSSSAGLVLLTKVSYMFFKDNYETAFGAGLNLSLVGLFLQGTISLGIIYVFGWRFTTLFYGTIALLFAIAAFFLLPGDADDRKSIIEVLKRTWEIIKDPWIIALSLNQAFLVGAFQGFSDVWIYDYMTAIYGFSKGESSILVNIFMFSFIGINFFVKSISRGKYFFELNILFGSGMAAIMFALIFFHNFSPLTLGIFLFLLGAFSGYQLFNFSWMAKFLPGDKISIATPAVNCANMMGAAIIAKFLFKGSMFAELGTTTETQISYLLLPIPLFCILGVAIVVLAMMFLGRPEAQLKDVEN